MLIPHSVLIHEVTIEPPLGNTGDGETYGPPVTTRGNLNRARKVVRSAAGDTLVAEATLIVGPSTTIEVGARVTADGSTYIADKVVPAWVGPRVHHKEVLLR